MMVLLLAVIAILLVDKDSIFFIRSRPPVRRRAVRGASERAYLRLGMPDRGAGGRCRRRRARC